jgi:hypothetical protein
MIPGSISSVDRDTVTPLFDYCHFPYHPAGPTTGKWRSSRLLERSFAHMGCDERFYEFVDTLRSGLGDDATVWGVKNVEGRLRWEYYFYNYGRQDSRMVPSRVSQLARPYFTIPGVETCDRLRYFMFSVDVIPRCFETGRGDGVHVYVHDVEDRQTALSYLVDQVGVQLENHYAFYRPSQEWTPLTIKVADSAMVDFSTIPLDQVLIPELVDCHTICVANKRDCDAVYFSRIDIDQFLFFLRRFEYPADIVDHIERNRNQLDHLRFDVGFDYRASGDRLMVRKSGYYGTF